MISVAKNMEFLKKAKTVIDFSVLISAWLDSETWVFEN